MEVATRITLNVLGVSPGQLTSSRKKKNVHGAHCKVHVQAQGRSKGRSGLLQYSCLFCAHCRWCKLSWSHKGVSSLAGNAQADST